MSWRLAEKPKVLQITKTLATWFAEMPCYRDRPLSPQRKEWIKEEAKRALRTFVWAYAIHDGKEYRVNGKHSSNAFVEMFAAGSAPEAVALVEFYYCDTLEDVAALFATYDSKKSARTTSDINRIFSAASPRLENITSRVLDLCVTGLATAHWGTAASAQSIENRARLMLANEAFCEFMNELLSVDAKDCIHIKRGPVAAAIAATFRKCQADAKKFWIDVRDGANAVNTSPQRQLERYLLSVSIKSKAKFKRGGEEIVKKIVDPSEVYARCILAWNAYRTNTATDLRWRLGTKVPSAA